MWLARLLISLLQRVSRRVARGWGWLVLHSSGATVGRGVATLGAPIVTLAPNSSIEIGDEVVLCSVSTDTALGVAHPVVLRTLRPSASITIGDDCGISGATICAAVSVSLGRRCLLGANVQIVDTDFHPLKPEGRRHSDDEREIAAAPVRIGDDVFIGANAIVLKGVVIGEGSVVGAGSVVTRSVPPRAIAAGNPAKVIGAVP